MFALLEGIESEDRFMARLLLKSGADWTREDYFNQAPLFGSIGLYDEGTVNFLLENGVDPNVSDSKGRLPLVHAAMGGYNPIVQALLEHGADPNAEDALGRTPLYVALMPEKGEGGDESLLELLLSYGANVNKEHQYSRRGGCRASTKKPLLVTALFDWNSIGVLTWLLEHGANPDTMDVGVGSGQSVLESVHEVVSVYEKQGDIRFYRLYGDMEDLLLEYGATPLQENLAI